MKLPDVPEVKSAIFISLNVPVAVEVGSDGEGGATLTHDVLYGTPGSRCCT